MEVMTEDVMNQGSIMVQMMSEQAKQFTAQDELMVLQPSYIDVTQMEDSCLNLKDGHTSLRKNSLQNDLGYVNTTQFFEAKFQSSLEGCFGVKSYDNEKF